MRTPVSEPQGSAGTRNPTSPDPLGPEDNPLAARHPHYPAPEGSDNKGPYNVRSDVRKDLLGQAVISEAHHTLMGTVIERISSAESVLHEAFMGLLKGFEVREIICDSTAHVRCALCI